MTETTFRKYDHLERLAHPDVADISFGIVHVFPKIDGTNASVWCDDDGVVQCGSRTRTLSAEADNAGFHAWVNSDDETAVLLRTLAKSLPHLIFYGEWLVPHSLKTYREDAWRRFYIFDVYTRATKKYLPFDDYREILEAAEQDVIHPLAIIENPSDNQLNGLRDGNTFLIKDDAGVGEGVVLKNYDWRNKHGRQPWGKMVRAEFKDAHRRAMPVGVTKGELLTEQRIVDDFVGEEFIRKEFAKVVTAVASDAGVVLDTDPPEYDVDGRTEILPDPPRTAYAEFVALNRHKIIPRFLGTFYLTFVDEEIRAVVKKLKNPVIDFSKLHRLMTVKAKRTLTEVF